MSCERKRQLAINDNIHIPFSALSFLLVEGAFDKVGDLSGFFPPFLSLS